MVWRRFVVRGVLVQWYGGLYVRGVLVQWYEVCTMLGGLVQWYGGLYHVRGVLV